MKLSFWRRKQNSYWIPQVQTIETPFTLSRHYTNASSKKVIYWFSGSSTLTLLNNPPFNLFIFARALQYQIYRISFRICFHTMPLITRGWKGKSRYFRIRCWVKSQACWLLPQSWGRTRHGTTGGCKIHTFQISVSVIESFWASVSPLQKPNSR